MKPAARLERAIARHPSALVAYSGGLDSALLALMTHQVLGERMLAVTSRSASLAPVECEEAQALAREHGFPHRLILTDELEEPAYRANGPDRCYHCKATLFRHLWQLARAEGYAAVLVGTHTGDLGDYRPGLKAATEAGVQAPFVEAGMDKDAIRELARTMGLRIWDKPAAACLASRIPYGMPVTLEILDQVGRAEEVLRREGFRGARVRHHGDLARLEVQPGELPLAWGCRERLIAGLKATGYRFVTLDLEGYRVGSLNEALR